MFFKITYNKIDKWTQKRQVDKLIKALDDKDVNVQRWAVQALAILQDMRAIEPLLRFQNNASLREEVERALYKFSKSLFIMTTRVAGGFMGDKEKQFVGAVPHLLVAMGKTAVPIAVENLNNTNSTARLIALTVLGALKATSFMDKITLCLNDCNPSVREQTAKILNKFGRGISAPAVMQAINKHNIIFSPDAVKLVRALNYEPTDTQDKINYFIALREFDQAIALGEDAIPKVVQRFTHPQEAIRETAAEALVKIGRPAVKYVMRMVEKEDWNQRTLAIKTIIRIKDPETLPLLVAQLEEPDSENGQAAKQVLQEFKNETKAYVESELLKEQSQIPEAAIQLVQLMGWKPKDKQAKIRIAILKNDLEAAAREGTAAIPALIQVIDAADSFQQSELIKVMGNIRAPETILALEKYLHGDDMHIKKAVVRIYRRVKGPEAIACLEKCLDEETPDVRCDIVEALAEFGEPRWKKVTKYTLDDFYQYAKLGSEAAVNTLVLMLTTEDKQERMTVAKAVVKLAKEKPKMLTANWSTIHRQLTSAHEDTHSDEDYDRSSDCTHMDNHEDQGLGLNFPETPPKGVKGSKDF